MKSRRKIKESNNAMRNRNGAKDRRPMAMRPMPPSPRRPLSIAVATRRQTPEEQRQYEAALDVFLAEMVRQHLDRNGSS